MADVFISYRNTPERRAFVQRLATILRVHEVTVWWDYGLEAGESYRAQITDELAKARVVSPLWCSESVHSKWVAMEAELGKDKLVPARVQKVKPPDAFEAIQAADLVGWDGSVAHPRVLAFVRRICERLGKSPNAPTDMMEELADLRLLTPLPEAEAGLTSMPSTPTHDYEFWKSEWQAHKDSEDVIELRAIATHAPDYFADKARARMTEIEEQQQLRARERAERERREAEDRYRAEGRILVEVRDGAGNKSIWPKPGAGEVFQDCWVHEGKRLCGPEMVVVPAGEFMMGDDHGDNDEKPTHQVSISEPFAVGRFAIMFDDWDTSLAAGGVSHAPDHCDWGRGRRPVINVSWDDATAYCEWLSEKTGKPYRLLSEAEWEYCCRAGTTTAYAFGDKITKEQAQFSERSAGSAGRTMEVGSFTPNAFGLLDMHGNAWEWCADTWHENYRGAPVDGSAWQGGNESLRVLRGGSWNVDPQELRSAYRDRYRPDDPDGFFGFRIARTLTPQQRTEPDALRVRPW